ncbi:TPA: hypothetical protein ACH3X1_012685 [Trebouxia sp. C0004]
MPFLVGICLVWLLLHATAAILKYFCGCTTLVISVFSVSVQTSKCNRIFYKFGRQHNAALRQWYSVGVAVAAMLGMSVIFMLLQEVWLAIAWIKESMSMGPEIVPGSGVPLAAAPGGQGFAMGLAVPGLTVPWGHAGYLWLATAASIAVHEAGHAVAAASEGVGVQHVGAFTLLLLPGAYVALDSGALGTLGPWRTLRVVCAGVWHNAVLCALCWLCALLLPQLLTPLYFKGTGAAVRVVNEGSPLSGQLEAGDNIWMLNQCPVTSSRSWLDCLASSNFHDGADHGRSPRSMHNEGYCVPQSLQQNAGSCSAGGLWNQCGGNDLCFVRGPEEESLEKWANAFATRKLQASRGLSGSCLHARSAAACPPCSTQGDPNPACPSGSVCTSPVVSPGDHMFKVCFHPSSSSEEARWLPGQASTIGRKLLSQQEQEEEEGGPGTWKAGKGFADHDLSYDVLLASSSQQDMQEAEDAADADSVHGTPAAQHAQRSIGAQVQHGEVHLPDQVAVNSAYLAAHPTKDAVKSGLASALQQHWPQQVPASSNTSVGSRSTIGSDAIGDRIGRVALANEHRKVIRQELSPKKELSCPHYLVYVGTSGQLMQALEVSDFVPKSSWIPLQWPHMIEQLLVYTFAVSGALALINMAPIWYLDGESAWSSAISPGHALHDPMDITAKVQHLL